jgi:two-component system, OmpR family, phosphate regulon response regulator PhoB
MQKVLIVDDEADNRKLLKDRLEREGFSVIAARNADEAYLAAVDSKPDLILTDVAMPGTDGIAFCQKLKDNRRTSAIPVILVSGVHKHESQQIEGIEHGADDYILKPYSPRLLLAKMKALLRRYGAPEELKEVLEAEGLTLDVQARIVTFQKRRISLTRKEFDVLTTFLRKRGQVLSVPYLLETVWGYDPADYSDPHTLQAHMSTLRRKLGPRLGKKIVNVPGLGYRFEA